MLSKCLTKSIILIRTIKFAHTGCFAVIWLVKSAEMPPSKFMISSWFYNVSIPKIKYVFLMGFILIYPSYNIKKLLLNCSNLLKHD